MKTLSPIIRATPNLVCKRGAAAIQEWQQTDRPWLELYGCSYHVYQEKRNRPNVIGFWAKLTAGGYYRFRPLATLEIGGRCS